MPYVLIFLGILGLLVPHPANFTPLGAVGLFAGAHCRPRTAWIVPIGSLLIVNIIVGFYNPVVMLFVYLGFLAGPLIGWAFLHRRRSVLRFGGAVLGSSTAFFILSNFGVWLTGMYPQTLSGFIDCYVRAIPYYQMTLLGNVIYGAVLFGGYALASQKFKRAEHAVG